MKFPGKMNFLIIGIVVLFFSAVLIHADDALPGADAPEGFPNGCIDCHSTTDSNDFSLKATLGEFEDHPSVTKIVNNVPTDCLMCHTEGSYAGDFKTITHENHLNSKDDDGFAANYGANCLACHDGYPQPGKPLIKSGAKNW